MIPNILKLALALLPVTFSLPMTKNTISYDSKSFIINGKRELLISGAIHYPRSTPQMWDDLFKTR
jgi:hypothetical protein